MSSYYTHFTVGKIVLQNTWHVKTEITTECQHTVEEKDEKPVRCWKCTKYTFCKIVTCNLRVKWLIIPCLQCTPELSNCDTEFIFYNCVTCILKTINVQPTSYTWIFKYLIVLKIFQIMKCMRLLSVQLNYLSNSCPITPKTNILPREGSIPQGPSILQF